jgi:hypothetical protein
VSTIGAIIATLFATFGFCVFVAAAATVIKRSRNNERARTIRLLLCPKCARPFLLYFDIDNKLLNPHDMEAVLTHACRPSTETT